MDRLTMLTAREQLMEDIDWIVEEFYEESGFEFEECNPDTDKLTRILCDAVCKNFPTEEQP
ncbi:MAG: hypothetical protein VW270_10025 [Candidatus Poseidoniales archaeon]